jgi:hypothetical protein
MNITELAKQVGAVQNVLAMGRHDGVLFTETELEKFATLVAAHEREECAKLCEKQYEYYGHDHVFAKAIRARSNT